MEEMKKLNQYVEEVKKFQKEYESLLVRETASGKARLRKIMDNMSKLKVEAKRETLKK